MWYDGLFEAMEAQRDDAQAQKMAAYMQNRFAFVGIPKPARAALEKPFLRASKALPPDWDFVFLCWEKDYREAQYTALSYLAMHRKQLTPADLPRLQRLITERAWWDTVDTLDAFVGDIVALAPALKETMRDWAQSDNLWLRRTAIDFQQEYKAATDAALLAEIICANLGSKEFFINKAIGWSLRDYSKVNPDWVRDFLAQHAASLAPLSVREASKYL